MITRSALLILLSAIIFSASCQQRCRKPVKEDIFAETLTYTIKEGQDLKLEIPHWLHTTCGDAHEMAGKPMIEYFDKIVDFYYNKQT